LHPRIFTEDEEDEISREIRQHDITRHQLFPSEEFETLIVDCPLPKWSVYLWDDDDYERTHNLMNEVAETDS
jgi:hypothetical protein